ncbi:MAG: 30S ribosomal protein S4 [Parcubacteria group bacterium]|jgi:small subunit ribosomal protein S4
MARSIDAKCRKCRRAGEKLFLKGDRCSSPKCAMVRKPYAPGVHGKKKTRGLSEYGRQLAMKQRIKRIYGVLERQFRKHFDEVKNKQGVTGDLFIARLEMRLDNVVYRIGFSSSRSGARQLANHGLIKVNGKKVSIPSFWIKVGDVVGINETKIEKNYFKNHFQILKSKKDFPAWIQFDAGKTEGKIIASPRREDVGSTVDPQMVVEYYSR